MTRISDFTKYPTTPSKDFSRFKDVPEAVKQRLRDKYGEDISFENPMNRFFVKSRRGGYILI